jgi:cytochrome c oxidase subunit I
MNISKSLKAVLLIQLLLPLTLLTLGIYHGLMQVIYRAGVISASSMMKLDYYQGLTLHGVINAVVLTTFFNVAFGHATIAHSLKKEPGKNASWVSLALMVIGTVMAAWAMLAGKASVLYTFYPPLKAHPFFYLGAALLIVGSWIPLGDWFIQYRRWAKENPGEKMPLSVLGTFVNFTVWLVCTLAVAYEVLVMLLPWSMGIVDTINVPLSRTLFWFFGHALVYFWLLPAYIMYYTILPKLAGGKLYSENAGRLVFLLFLILSIPIGAHHQFAEPSITPNTKFFQSILTFGVVIPSFLTAFTIAASLEYGARKRGAHTWIDWMFKLPYFDKNNGLFGYLIMGMILFIFGGLTGIVNASYQLSNTIHNTAWIPGHFHMTVAGPVFLGIIGMSMYMIAKMTGKEIKFKAFYTMTPYLWTIGILVFSSGMMWGGLMGEPRRTNLGLTYTNPESPMFRSEWVSSTELAMYGGIIMTLAFVLYTISLVATLVSKRVHEQKIEFDVTENLHPEPKLKMLHNMRPWLVTMFVVIILSYTPALLDVLRFTGRGAPRYNHDNPVPETPVTNYGEDGKATEKSGDNTTKLPAEEKK